MSRSLAAPARSAPAKGHVEVFQISDEQYYDVYLDGEYYDRIARESPASYLLSSSMRRPLAQKADVEEADLRFSFSQPLYRAMALRMDFDAMTYDDMVKWRTGFPNQWDFLALPIDEVERKIIEMCW